jgi:FMN phosphatase YigB (HAD superfamily)
MLIFITLKLVYATFINSGVLPKGKYEMYILFFLQKHLVYSSDLDSHYDTIFDRLYLRFTSDEGYAIFPEVPSVLDELKRKGFKMGVISNSDERVSKWDNKFSI